MNKIQKLFHKYWPILLIILVWFIFSYPFFLKDLVPFPTRYLADFFPPWNNLYGHPYKNGAMPDVITQLYPWKLLVVESLKNGQIPGWNPYQFAGNPHMANVQSAAFTPFNILFFILPFIDAWSLLVLAQPLIAGICMYIFMRSLSVGKLGAYLASISFMFCSFIVTWMAYGTLSFAVAYIPLLLYGMNRYVSKKDIVSQLIIVFSVALSLVSGHMQMSMYLLISGFAYAVFVSKREKSLHIFIRLSGLMLGGIVLSLPQLIPSFSFYQQAVRSELFRNVESIPFTYIVTLLAPDFFGNPVTRNDWYGHYAEWGGFAGVVTLFVSGLTFFIKNKSSYVKFFIIFAFVTLLLAFQTPLTSLIVSARIPVISTSGASRIIVLFSFAVSVLSGIGLDALTTLPYDKKRKLIKQAGIYVGIFSLLFISVWILLITNNLLFIPQVTAEQIFIAKHNLILPSILFFSASVLCGILLLTKNKLFLKTVPYVLLLIATFDMLRFATKWMPFDEREFLYPQVPVLSFMQENIGNYRVYGPIGNEALSPFHIQGIEGYDPLSIRRYGELVQAAQKGVIIPPERSLVKLDNNGVYAKPLMDLLGVKYIFNDKGFGRGSWVFPHWNYTDSINQTPVYEDDFYAVYENTAAFDRAFILQDYIVETDGQKIVDHMFSERMDLLKTVILEKDPDTEFACDAMHASANIQEYSPNHITISVNATCPAILVLTDNYYPGWVARVNGEDEEILRADYTFRAVVVPAGASIVEFAYENWYL